MHRTCSYSLTTISRIPNKQVQPCSVFLSRQGYDGLEKKLKEVFSERSNILHQLSKTSKELDSIKGNLQVGSIIVSDTATFEGQACPGFWAGAHFQPV